MLISWTERRYWTLNLTSRSLMSRQGSGRGGLKKRERKCQKGSPTSGSSKPRTKRLSGRGEQRRPCQQPFGPRHSASRSRIIILSITSEGLQKFNNTKWDTSFFMSWHSQENPVWELRGFSCSLPVPITKYPVWQIVILKYGIHFTCWVKCPSLYFWLY